jgi:hypothetical protein
MIVFCLWGCTSVTPEKPIVITDNLNLSDINLVIKSTQPIDSIWLADIGQKESYFVPFKDTVKINLKRKIDDLHNIHTFLNGDRIGTQLWLDGENLIIDIEIESNSLEVRNVNTSTLYERSLRYKKTFKELVEQEKDSVEIDDYIFSELRKNLDSPLSHAIVSNYLHRNQNNTDSCVCRKIVYKIIL